MKYALISDVHGNLPALEAVVEDAKAQGAQQYLLLGDYIEDLPWPNEVTEYIRSLDNTVIIRGNKEDYLENIRKNGTYDLSIEQFAPISWSYSALTPENLDFLISLPETASIQTPGGAWIRLIHISPIFYRHSKIELFRSSHYYDRMNASPFTHDEYLNLTTQSVLENDEVMADISYLQEDVYAFGHNHLQWHMQTAGKCIINPGSCGFPADFNPHAPYSLLSETSDGWLIEERRVAYNVERAVQALISSPLYEYAEIWSRFMIKHLRTGSETISHFLQHAEETARRQNESINPVSNRIWREAARSFSLFDIYAD